MRIIAEEQMQHLFDAATGYRLGAIEHRRCAEAEKADGNIRMARVYKKMARDDDLQHQTAVQVMKLLGIYDDYKRRIEEPITVAAKED